MPTEKGSVTWIGDDEAPIATIDAVNGEFYVNSGALNLVAGEIATADLADSAVTNAKIGALAVDTAELAAGAVSEAKIEAATTDGLNVMRTARATYDFAADGGAISAIDSGVTIPANAVIMGGVVEVITTCTSSGDLGTMAISVEGADDIVAAAAIGTGTPWDDGLQAIIPKFNTPETTSVKTTVARAITFTIAVEAFTAGKFHVYLHYVVSDG
jgi:hypothetical protein